MRILFNTILPCSVFLFLVLAYFLPGAYATEEYAAQTGRDCEECHVDPLGGGELIPKGEAFAAELASKGKIRHLGPVKRAIRLLVGYLHMLAGIVWLGTIFYVHILLKPAYASKGLPRGELMLGWSGIIIIAITGTLLTYARMPSLDSFYTTRFGILLSIKIGLYLLMVATAFIATFILGPRMKKRLETSGKEGGEFSPEELSGFDGKEGRKAYVAVDGIVYDLTTSPRWKDGKHMRHLAGNDMTALLKQAPHGPDKLDNFTQVGTLNTTGARPKNMPRAVFYVFAYMNLIIVFLIVGVLACMRWL
jgi:predicted heme/steroid binding protein